MSDLIERLRAQNYCFDVGKIKVTEPRNPDGPEAAAAIERLSERVRELEAAAALRQSPSVILWQTNDGQGWWEVEDPEFWKAKGCPVRGLGVVTGEEDARQSPSVEEVARVIDPTLEGVDLSRPCWPTSRIGRALAKAQAIATLYGGRDG